MNNDELQKLWEATLGSNENQWATLSAGATYKPADEMLSGATLSAATLSGATLPSATLSGATLGDNTLSGGNTLGADDAQASHTMHPTQYDMLAEIGRGGMGVVYRARQGSLKRDVAIKQIIPEQANPGSTGKFISEALVTGVLDHPNIVPVHELGQNKDGSVFLSMKLVGGTEWKHLLHPENDDHIARAAEFDQQGHIGILLNVCNAISFAHSKGIVHRDLKPENVMVGEFGEVLVMDWGIAVDISDTKNDDPRAQHKSTVKGPSGTPSYMAPELAEGRGNDIGAWTDVYLLGAMLHEVLTGQPPHLGKTLMAVLLAASNSEPAQYPATVPAGLQTICHRAMHKDCDKRFADVDGFRAALEEYLHNRESMLITSKADDELTALPSEVNDQQRNDIYARYAKVVARYEQALELWNKNSSAELGARKARTAYAHLALTGGDLGLAEAQAAPLPDDENANVLRQDISAAQTARSKTAAAAKRTRLSFIAAVIIIIGGLAVGITLVMNEQGKTEQQRDKAVAAESEAKEQEHKALSVLSITQANEAFNAHQQGDSNKALQKLWEAVQTELSIKKEQPELWIQYQLVNLGAQSKQAQLKAPHPQFSDTPFTAVPTDENTDEPHAALIGSALSPSGDEIVSTWWWSQNIKYSNTDVHHGTQLIRWSIKDNKIINSTTVPEKISSPLWFNTGIITLSHTYNSKDNHQTEAISIANFNPSNFKMQWSHVLKIVKGAHPWLTRSGHESVIVNGTISDLEIDPSTGIILNRRLLTDELDGTDNLHMYNELFDDSEPNWKEYLPFKHGNWLPQTPFLVVQDNKQPNQFIFSGRPSFAKGHYSSTLKLWGKHSGEIISAEGELIKQFHICQDAATILVLTHGLTSNRLLRYNAANKKTSAILDDNVSNSLIIADADKNGQRILTYDNDNGSIFIYGQQANTLQTTPWPKHLHHARPLHYDHITSTAIFLRADNSVVSIRLPSMETIWELAADVSGTKQCIGVSVDGLALVYQKAPEDGKPLVENGISLRHCTDGTHWADINPPKEKVAKDDKLEDDGWMTSADSVFVHAATQKVVVYNNDGIPWGIYDQATQSWLDTDNIKEMPAGYRHNTGFSGISLRPAPTGVICQETGFEASGIMGESQTDISWLLNLEKNSIKKLPVNLQTSVPAQMNMLIGNSGGIGYWNIDTLIQTRHFDSDYGIPRCVTPDLHYALTENEQDMQLHILDLKRGICLSSFPLTHGPVLSVVKYSRKELIRNRKFSPPALPQSNSPRLNTKGAYISDGLTGQLSVSPIFAWRLQSDLSNLSRIDPDGFTSMQLVPNNTASQRALHNTQAKTVSPMPLAPTEISHFRNTVNSFSSLTESSKINPPDRLSNPLSGTPAWRIYYVLQTLAAFPKSIRDQISANKELCDRMLAWQEEAQKKTHQEMLNAASLFSYKPVNEQGQRIAKDGSIWYWVPPGDYTVNQFKGGKDCTVTLTQGFLIRGNEITNQDTATGDDRSLPEMDLGNPYWEFFTKTLSSASKSDFVTARRATIAGLSTPTAVMRLPTCAELMIAIQLHGGSKAPWVDEYNTCTTLDLWSPQDGTFVNPYGDRGAINWVNVADKLFIKIKSCKGSPEIGSMGFGIKADGIKLFQYTSSSLDRIFPTISGL